MKRIALATCEKLPGLTPDEEPLISYLRKLGLEAAPIVWSGPSQDTWTPAAIVIRSCWDYHTKPQRFLNWLSELESSGRKVFNPTSILRWNLEKTYLLELQKQGIRIPATLWFERGAFADLSSLLEKNHWNRAVVKPTISASAWRTFAVTIETARARQAEFEDLLSTGGVMIQKFVEEVQTNGEWSFVFFQKEFSHAVLKRPKAGEFRVQKDYGGTAESSLHAPTALIKKAQGLVESIPQDLLYARVDCVEKEGDFCLMELELIEPQLFLRQNENAVQRFAEAILRNC